MMGFWEGHVFTACGKTPIRDGFGKGTSSTRAVTAAESIAASSRWGNAAMGDHVSRSRLDNANASANDIWLVLHLMIAGRLHWRKRDAQAAPPRRPAPFHFS